MNAQLVRLYDTVFDRAPDAGGLEFWNGASHNGFGLRDLANFFIAAPEFASTYGEPTTRGFVESLYQNILDREGEAEGIAFWTNALDSGMADRAQVVVGFSESAEHVQQMEQPATSPDRKVPEDLVRSPNAHPNQMYGTNNDDYIIGTSDWDLIYSWNGDDKVFGGNDKDHINGGVGNDTLYGEYGNDTLVGDVGDDFLGGGPGDDILIGGPGRDRMIGSESNDVFVIEMSTVSQGDTIAGFQPGDSVRFIGDLRIAPYEVSAPSPDSPLSFDLDMTREHWHMIRFEGLTHADAGWVRETFIFG